MDNGNGNVDVGALASLDGWVLVVTDCGSFIGRGPLGPPEPVGLAYLSPAYAWVKEPVMTQQGLVWVQTVCTIEQVHGWNSLPIEKISTPWRAWQDLSRLPAGEQREIIGLIQDAEKSRLQVRAKSAGIELAGRMPAGRG